MSSQSPTSFKTHLQLSNMKSGTPTSMKENQQNLNNQMTFEQSMYPNSKGGLSPKSSTKEPFQPIMTPIKEIDTAKKQGQRRPPLKGSDALHGSFSISKMPYKERINLVTKSKLSNGKTPTSMENKRPSTFQSNHGSWKDNQSGKSTFIK